MEERPAARIINPVVALYSLSPAVLYVRKRHMNGFGEAALVENRPWVTPQTSV